MIDNPTTEEKTGVNQQAANEPPQPTPPSFSEITGGKFESWEQVNERLSSLESEAGQYKSRYDELEAGRYANETSKRYDELVRGGASQGELETFVRLQSIDPNTLAPENAIKLKLQLENPTATQSQIDEIFNYDYAALFDEYAEPAAKTKANLQMDRDANAARQLIASKKVESTETSSMRQQRETLAQRERNFNEWESKLPSLLTGQKANVSWEDGEAEFSGEYGLGLEQELDVVKAQLRETGIPVNEQNVQAVRAAAMEVHLGKNFNQYLETATRDAYAKGYEKAKKEASNSAPVQRTEPVASATFDRFSILNADMPKR